MPHVATRKLLIDVPDPILGTVKLVGPVAKLSGNTEPLTASCSHCWASTTPKF